ncbi:MAG: hypothetical protein RIC14_14245 [Filomicrobium sp.]
MRIIMPLLRVLCYLALAVMLFGAIALFGPFLLGVCEDASSGTVKCTDPTYRWFFETGFMIVMMGIFTGLPSLLALGGIVFSVIDLRRWLRR